MLSARRLSSRATRGGIGLTRGVTLIELMVTITVLAIALAVAAPSLSQTLANYRVRSASEGMMNGLNLARAEAVRRNTPVSFTLSGAGSGWTVAQVAPATTLQARSDGEVPAVSATSSTASLTVTFRPTGLVDTTGVRLSQINVASAVAGTEARRIDIFGGGLIRMCDPTVTTVGDPARC